MSKFFRPAAIQKEQVAQVMRRARTLQSNKAALDSAQLLFDAEPTEQLKKANPSELGAFQVLREAGLTERHTLVILGNMFADRLRADAKAAREKAASEQKA